MKRLLSILLLFIFLLPSVSKVWILVDFKLNQDFISQVLCINQSQPALGCNGHCVLSDSLKKSEEANQPALPTSIQDKVEIKLNLPFVAVFVHDKPQIDKNSIQTMTAKPLPAPYLNKLFRPPIA